MALPGKGKTTDPVDWVVSIALAWVLFEVLLPAVFHGIAWVVGAL